MASVLHQISRTALDNLARGLRAGRIRPPYSALALSELVPANDRAAVTGELSRLASAGMTPEQIGIVMELLAAERARQQADQDRVEMVWTGPDQEGLPARDTGVVARELLSQASRSLLITTFSLSRDSRTFEPVGVAMERNPELEVTLVLHVDAPRSMSGSAAVAAFASEFWANKWPWPTRPKVYYDPRGVAPEPGTRALQHSKCIVADLERVLITSANYTEAGQLRNIELGVVMRDRGLAMRVDERFRNLIHSGMLARL